MDLTSFPLVEIVWEDARFMHQGWMSLEDAKKEAKEPLLIRTAGYLVDATEDFVLIAASINEKRSKQDYTDVADLTNIPRSLIRGDITELTRVPVVPSNSYDWNHLAKDIIAIQEATNGKQQENQSHQDQQQNILRSGI